MTSQHENAFRLPITKTCSLRQLSFCLITLTALQCPPIGLASAPALEGFMLTFQHCLLLEFCLKLYWLTLAMLLSSKKL